MQNFILEPLFSTLVSILLFFGSYELGNIIIKNLKLRNTIEKISVLEFQYFTFGFLFLLIILFPMVSFTNHAKIILQFASSILLILSINFFSKIYRICFVLKNEFNKEGFIFLLFAFILLLYFLLGLAPLTSADVLDYHVGSALNILRFDKYMFYPEWFTSLQSGNGEILIALGLSVGSEQFGSLVQFSSIFTISGIIMKFSDKKKIFNSKYFLILTILTCPILIFLLSGNKPQIFFSSLMLFALALNFIKPQNEKEVLIIYLIINLIICTCVIGKFSFNLIGFLIWSLSTYRYLNKKNYLNLFAISLLIFITMYFPFILWKFENLGGTLYNYIFSPFPLHLPGYETFFSHNKGSQEIPFPYFLVYTTPSRFTEFLGANTFLFLLLIFYIKNKNVRIILALSFLFILVSNLFASPSARYYLDIILWASLGITMLKDTKRIEIIKYIFYPQILIIILVLAYSVYNFLPGALSRTMYNEIKHKYAFMYSGFDWLNKNIPDGSKTIIINRPISQYKDFPISGNFIYFTNKKQSFFYKKTIKKYKPEYLAYLGGLKPNLRHLEKCVDEIIKFEENVGFIATRNPFNRGSSYNAYLYKFDYKKLPNC